MKKNLLLSTLFLLSLCFAKAQSWQWAICEQQTNGEGYSVSRDPSDNVFLVSGLSSTAMIGSTTFTNAAMKTICSKYDPNGNNLWNYAIYANTAIYPSVACDNAGNAYIAAVFNGTMVIATNTFVSAGTMDFLVVKLDANGNFVWARTGGGTGQDYTTNIAVDAVGNSYICGYSSSTLITLGTNTLSVAAQQMIVTKFDANGNNLWAISSASSTGQTSRASAIAIDNASNVYVTGMFFSNMVLGTQTITAAGGQDVFIARISSNGTPVWLQGVGGSSTEQSWGIDVDPAGDIYAAGSFAGSNVTIGNSMFTSIGGTDAWVTKFTAAGTYLWSRQVGSQGTDIGYSVAPYSGGVFFATSVLSPTIQIGTTTYTANQQDGMGFVQYDASGNMLYATTIAGGGDDILDICQANGCTIYVGGDLFVSPVTVGTAVLTKTTTEALFLARFQMSSSMPTVSITGPSAVCAGGSVTLTAGGASTYTWSTGAVSNSITLTPTTNTVVVVTGAGSQYTCSATQAHSIQVSAAPVVSLTASSTLICQGATATLTAAGANTYSWSSGPTTSLITVNPFQNTTYTVVGSVPGGCSNTAQVQINTTPAPSITLVPTSTLVCKNSKVTFTVTGASTYTWNNGSHTPTQSYTVTANAVITVSATGFQNACIASATRQLSVSACAGIDDNGLAEVQMKVYPNPASNQINVLCESNDIVTLFDGLGKQIAKYKVVAEEPLAITIAELPAGIYFIKSQEQNHTIRFIKAE